MKTLFTLIALVISATAFATSSFPEYSVFKAIDAASFAASFRGYNLTACLDERNQLVLGAISSDRASSFQVLIADRAGKLEATQPLKSDAEASFSKFVYQGNTWSFSPGQEQRIAGSMNATFSATLKNGSIQKSVHCFMMIDANVKSLN